MGRNGGQVAHCVRFQQSASKEGSVFVDRVVRIRRAQRSRKSLR